MDDREPIPSSDDFVAITERELAALRRAAERMLADAFDAPFPPDARDEASAAVHMLDAYLGDQLAPGIDAELLLPASELKTPIVPLIASEDLPLGRVPDAFLHARALVFPHGPVGERRLAFIRELVELAAQIDQEEER
jgi:hypothetical protein